MLAYRSGIFPWYNPEEPIIWWSPDPRFVLFPDKLYLSKTTQRIFRNHTFEVTYNKNFSGVIEHCKHVPREGQDGPWITKEMKAAYIRLHELGHAKSIEVWQEGRLVGGMYGIDLGNVFSGESMFSLVSNASKIALISFIQDFSQRGGKLFDCQVHSEHLASFGAEEIPRADYLTYLDY
jgi:leucyl/phenylalanyl-tRNA--protein transferase